MNSVFRSPGRLSLLFGLAWVLATPAFAQAVKTRVRDSGGPSIAETQAAAYNGPQARIAVSRFTNKSQDAYNWYSPEIGDGMADMLTTALVNSGRFIVLERQALEDVLGEQDLGASGRVRQDTAAPIGEIEGAELLVVAAVTEFEDHAAGTGGGLGGIGGGVFGAIGGSRNKAHMAIDLRLIDAKTSRVLMATSVEGEARDYKAGGLLGGFGSGFGVAGGLATWKNTPREKALRVVIERAAEEIIRRTPANYYHGNVAPAAAETPAGHQPVTHAAELDQQMVITGTRVNAYQGPNAQSPVQFTLAAGAMVERLLAIPGWVQVRNDQGRTGWVMERDAAQVK